MIPFRFERTESEKIRLGHLLSYSQTAIKEWPWELVGYCIEMNVSNITNI